jgi:hypothetical protein
MWWDSPFLSSQLDKIGAAKARLLADNGLGTAARLCAATPADFERILGQKQPSGATVCC